ncbi:hypothetical protein D3C75_478880 [compost metagenome]
MYVRPFEDLLSNIDIQRKDSDTKKSFISISRKSIRTSINVKLHNDIDSTIVIRRKGVNDKISKIVINKPSISSSIKVFNFEVINSFVNVRVNDKKSINSKINIPFSSNLNSHISVKNHSSINSTLNINSGYFKSSITIRSYKDLNTKMIIRIRYINDIPSSITIGKINSYVFIT